MHIQALFINYGVAFELIKKTKHIGIEKCII